MLSRRYAASLLAVILCAGCQSSFLPAPFTQIVGYRSGNGERENPADQSSDPWVEDVGTVARQEHNIQKIVDPLKLRNVLMSSKARSIERNLGIGD